jgi:hypothetical protein
VSEAGDPLVVFPGNVAEHAIPARTTVPLSAGDTDAELALLFEAGDPGRPLVSQAAHRFAWETAKAGPGFSRKPRPKLVWFVSH